MFCKNCGNEIGDKAAVCAYCGRVTNNSVVSEESFVTTFLLCLFFGIFGAHRFYTGQTVTAIAQLILTLTWVGTSISIPWVLCDFIMIITGGFKTTKGEPFSK